MIEALNVGVAILILALATFTIVARDSLAAAVGFIAYGLLLTLIWLQLHAVDVALMEGAIGGGLTCALVITAAARLRTTEVASRAGRAAWPARSCSLRLVPQRFYSATSSLSDSSA